jgi:hypothetical protein
MTVEMNATCQVVPFGALRVTLVIPSRASGLSRSEEDDVRVLRGNTADEAVISISSPDHPSGEKE